MIEICFHITETITKLIYLVKKKPQNMAFIPYFYIFIWLYNDFILLYM